jgi:hypothetical protein
MNCELYLLSDIHENALVIGCGWIPYTVIHLAKKTTLQITAIDTEVHALTHAKKIVQMYGFEKRVHFLQTDGSIIPLSEYSVIIFSHGVEPKDKVLDHIIQTIRRETKILYRTNWNMFQVIFGKDKLPAKLHIVKSCYRLDLIQSLLLELVKD